MLARVYNLVEIYAVVRHMRRNPASRSPVLGSALDRRHVYCDWLMVKQGCQKSEDHIPISHDQETSRRISTRVASPRVST